MKPRGRSHMIESEDPPEYDPVKRFAGKLQQLRRSEMSYEEMEGKTGCPHEKLLAAASGKIWPAWRTVEAYVSACDGDIEEWHAEWEAVGAALENTGVDREDEISSADDESPEPSDEPPGSDTITEEQTGRTRRIRPAILILGAVALTVGIVMVTALVPGGTPRTDPPAVGSAPVSTVASSAPSPTSTAPPSTSAGLPNGPATPTGKPTGSPPVTTKNTPSATAPTNVGKQPAQPSEDPGRYDKVQEKRVVELIQQQGYNWVDIEYWRHDSTKPGELQIDTQKVFTNLGAKLTIIPDDPLANRERCARATGWRDSISFAELHVGSQLCGLSHMDRYASLVVRLLPGSPASNGRFTFYGITWNG
ncbi:hypothetical protein JOF56_003372 [Kibdelosporangium banguiense]|uniref:PASTA domain-containing protein n=1 Tax=Kibdelosporangium banguiense TaxID=1365924 RepID=A0ABS4TEZ3_9PSEU|nr:hypothetical protein [Kibdelosporangium banguiense]MBP2322987.1 hypothetical protein [Kibdelosporangium banguiense]